MRRFGELQAYPSEMHDVVLSSEEHLTNFHIFAGTTTTTTTTISGYLPRYLYSCIRGSEELSEGSFVKGTRYSWLSHHCACSRTPQTYLFWTVWLAQLPPIELQRAYQCQNAGQFDLGSSLPRPALGARSPAAVRLLPGVS